MISIAFPDMLSNVRTNLVTDHEATSQNLILMLKSDRTSLLGDPYFGTLLKRMLYEQNSIVLQDLVIDELYTSIITFMPQIRLSRNDITLERVKENIYANIKCTNLLDYQVNLYKIKLTEDSEN